jgi:hypothetical protein
MKARDKLVLVPLQMLDIKRDVTHQPSLILHHLVTQNKRIEFIVKTVLNRQRRQLKITYCDEFIIVGSVDGSKGGYFFRRLAHLALKFHIGLSGGHEALFALKEEGLAPILVGVTDEFLCEIVDQNFTGPRLAARHAVGILSGF